MTGIHIHQLIFFVFFTDSILISVCFDGTMLNAIYFIPLFSFEHWYLFNMILSTIYLYSCVSIRGFWYINHGLQRVLWSLCLVCHCLNNNYWFFSDYLAIHYNNDVSQVWIWGGSHSCGLGPWIIFNVIWTSLRIAQTEPKRPISSYLL